MTDERIKTFRAKGEHKMKKRGRTRKRRVITELGYCQFPGCRRHAKYLINTIFGPSLRCRKHRPPDTGPVPHQPLTATMRRSRW